MNNDDICFDKKELQIGNLECVPRSTPQKKIRIKKSSMIYRYSSPNLAAPNAVNIDIL